MSLYDVQSSADPRKVPINQVGVKGVRHPLQVRRRDGSVLSTVATANLYVGLEHDVKGTHMSRFVEILHEQVAPLTQEGFRALLGVVAGRLKARTSHVELSFPFFVVKRAPVSSVPSYLDYEVSFVGDYEDGQSTIALRAVIPVTSLCPCSKKISDYGAHNQRSHITLHVEPEPVEPGPKQGEPRASLTFEELIETAEQCASMELYGILKRPDEKYVTEKAYENAKFVEDMIRDLALRLRNDNRVARYRIEVENFESIHNHSAYASIEHDKRAESQRLPKAAE